MIITYLVPCGSTEHAKNLHLKLTNHLTNRGRTYFASSRKLTITIWGLFRNPFDRVRILFTSYSESEASELSGVLIASTDLIECYFEQREDVSK